jgi:hypothetical protein
MDYTELKPHPISKEAQAYIDSMTADQRALHEMATRLLASSYFVEQTRGYIAWKQNNVTR